MFREICPISKPNCTRLGFPVFVALGLAFLNLGCGAGPQAEFKFRESTDDLIPEANRAIKKTLKDSFGSPNSLVAWERFPVDYGGIKGTVASTEGASLAVTLEGENRKIVSGAPLVWVSGSQAGTTHGVEPTRGGGESGRGVALTQRPCRRQRAGQALGRSLRP